MATPAKVPPTGPVEVACIVCGQKSHRGDWQSHPSPACDTHTKDEVEKAKAALTKAK